ncbi:hypothetical protein NLG97_g1750 [Lecanicillium saksenae]|uniref:Uncharacterized protein n=1 Tax=Lecanicillium saksenae TaxID=468837 RepID=A0ACC1R5I6_9HYPO|nr:hypothetical protein NLG97_g1750 [Lecanicillium saksenae]
MAAVCACILCGVDIDDINYTFSQNWTSIYRVVYRDGDNILVSGIAQRDGSPVWRVPRNPMMRWDEVSNEDDLLELPVMRSSARDGRHGFVLHEACWRLLQTAPGAAYLSLDRMWKVCRSSPLPVWFNGVCWGHDYEGRLTLETDAFYPWLERFTVSNDHLGDIGAFENPYSGWKITDTPALFETTVRLATKQVRAPTQKDCFSRLPQELREMILVLLPTNDALTLRLVSPAFQYLFSSVLFWQSRFSPAGERGYVFEARDEKIFNNVEALINLYHASRRSAGNSGLLNRKRVWKLAQRLLILAQPPSASCLPCPRAGEEDWQGWASLRSRVQRAEYLHEIRIRDIPHYPTTTVEMKIPPGPIKIGVAMVDTGIWDYITGIRLVDPDGKVHSAGYIFENNEKLFSVDVLCGFRVAMGPYGVRALQALDSRAQACKWAGRVEGVPVSERLVAKSQLSRLRISFDQAYKITALAVIPETQATEDEPVGSTDALRQTAVWYPEPPPENLVLNEESFTGIHPLSTGYKPLSWIQFGGEKGNQLPLLRGLLSNFDEVLYGFRFTYDSVEEETYNPDPVRLGQLRNSLVPDASLFTIDGAGGERICSLTVGIRKDEEDESPAFLRHGIPEYYCITTNRGRITTLGQLGNDLEMRDMAVAPGTTITGLYGHFAIRYG